MPITTFEIQEFEAGESGFKSSVDIDDDEPGQVVSVVKSKIQHQWPPSFLGDEPAITLCCYELHNRNHTVIESDEQFRCLQAKLKSQVIYFRTGNDCKDTPTSPSSTTEEQSEMKRKTPSSSSLTEDQQSETKRKFEQLSKEVAVQRKIEQLSKEVAKQHAKIEGQRLDLEEQRKQIRKLQESTAKCAPSKRQRRRGRRRRSPEVDDCDH